MYVKYKPPNILELCRLAYGSESFNSATRRRRHGVQGHPITLCNRDLGAGITVLGGAP